ncbi:MAG: hypothetical protein FWD78_14340 [Treponema sp.]|nr:hypothetical protein [Treponema sp.]
MAVCGTPAGRELDSSLEPHIFLHHDPLEYPAWMQPAGKPLCFNVKDTPFMARPYFELGSDDPFTCYPYFYPDYKK